MNWVQEPTRKTVDALTAAFTVDASGVITFTSVPVGWSGGQIGTLAVFYGPPGALMATGIAIKPDSSGLLVGGPDYFWMSGHTYVYDIHFDIQLNVSCEYVVTLTVSSL
jgi:hypothetical protein